MVMTSRKVQSGHSPHESQALHNQWSWLVGHSSLDTEALHRLVTRLRTAGRFKEADRLQAQIDEMMERSAKTG